MPCALSSQRTLHSALISDQLSTIGQDCARPVLLDVRNATVGVVVTWSAGSLAAQVGHSGLRHALHELRRSQYDTRVIFIGKGSRCSQGSMIAPLAASRRAHCIEGPNVGAREAHSIWQFCADFYEHLPRVVLFMQDDPVAGALRSVLSMPDWPGALERSVAQRALVTYKDDTAKRGSHARPDRTWSHPWAPAACACHRVVELFSRATYGGYSPIHWWMRTFLAPYHNANTSLPDQIWWPQSAQFALPATAIRHRSKGFFEANVRLTEVPAPLKSNVISAHAKRADAKRADAKRAGPAAGERAGSSALENKIAKWANFGRLVVDFGPKPPRNGEAYGDTRIGINGMDFAQLFERSWFVAFDPALPERKPDHPTCFTADAIERSPMRCTGVACPYPAWASRSNVGGRTAGGCVVTDALEETRPPAGWRFSPADGARHSHLRHPPVDHQEARCVAPGCIVSGAPGSGAWLQ